MPNRQVKPLTEGGILTAVLVVLAMLSLYIPFVNMLWSLPIALIGARHGLRYSVLTSLVGAIATMVFVQVAQGVVLLLGGALTGIVLGSCLKRQMTGVKTFAWTAVAATVSTILLLGAMMVLLQTDVMQMGASLQEVVRETAREVAQNMASSEAERAQLEVLAEKLTHDFVLLLPSGLIAFGLLCALLNYTIVRVVMRRLNMAVADFPSFDRWRFPVWMLYLFVLSLVGIYWGDKWNSEMLFAVAYNTECIVRFFLFLQGISLLWYVKGRNTLIGRIWWLPVLLAFVSPLVEIAFVVLGGIDIWMNYRKIGEKQV